MQLISGIITGIIFLTLIIITIIWRQNTFKKIYEEYAEKKDSYTLVLNSQDKIYGIILNPELKETFSGTEAKDFTVTDSENNSIKIKEAFLCNIDGDKLTEDVSENTEHTHIFLLLEKEDELSADSKITINHPEFLISVTQENESFKKL